MGEGSIQDLLGRRAAASRAVEVPREGFFEALAEGFRTHLACFFGLRLTWTGALSGVAEVTVPQQQQQ